MPGRSPGLLRWSVVGTDRPWKAKATRGSRPLQSNVRGQGSRGHAERAPGTRKLGGANNLQQTARGDLPVPARYTLWYTQAVHLQGAASLTRLLRIKQSPTAIQGGVAGDDLDASKEAVLFLFPFPYEHAAIPKGTQRALHGEFVVRCGSRLVRTRIRNRVHDVVTIWAVAPDDGPVLLFFSRPEFFLDPRFVRLKQPHPHVTTSRQGGSLIVRGGFSLVWRILSGTGIFPSPFLTMANAKETSSTKDTNGPVETFRIRGLSASIFENRAKTASRTVTFYKVALQRTYKDGDEWKTTTSFGRDDLPIAKLLLERSWQFILDSEASRGRESDESEE